MISAVVSVVLVIGTPAMAVSVAVAADSQQGNRHAGHMQSGSGAQVCQSMSSQTTAAQRADGGHASSPLLEGIQIETADIQQHELFFEKILHGQAVMRIDHPQVDHIRGYCYRDVLIVVRQDLKTPRPTGWVQVNFAVEDVSGIKDQLEQAVQNSPLAQQEEAERTKAIRIRLKPDVPRNNCRVARLEVAGPEGFMVGFDQFKEGSCQTKESPQPMMESAGTGQAAK
jgi:hypothetical protein